MTFLWPALRARIGAGQAQIWLNQAARQESNGARKPKQRLPIQPSIELSVESDQARAESTSSAPIPAAGI